MPSTLRREDVTPALLTKTGGDLTLARQHVVDMFRHRTVVLLTMLGVSSKVAAVLANMRWQLLRFDEPLLAYSDQPVVVWPVDTEIVDKPPCEPSFAPLASLEVRVPLSPQLLVLMTWVDQPDREVLAVHQRYAAETNALVIGQRDKQWMHRPDCEPPVASDAIRPLSRAFEDRYTAASALASWRRQQTAAYIERVRDRELLDEIDILTINAH